MIHIPLFESCIERFNSIKKTLTNFLIIDVLIKFMDSCSNLEQLQIGEFCYYGMLIFDRQIPVHDSFDCLAKQTHLRKLSLNSIEFIDGFFIERVRNCFNFLPNLNVIHCSHLYGKQLDLRKGAEKLPEIGMLTSIRTVFCKLGYFSSRFMQIPSIG